MRFALRQQTRDGPQVIPRPICEECSNAHRIRASGEMCICHRV